MGGVTWAREKEPNRVEMLPGIVSSTPFKSTGAPRKHNQEGLRERKGGPGPCWPRLGSAGPSGRSGPSPPAPPPASRHPPGCRAARRLRAQGLPRPAGPENAPDGGRPPPGGVTPLESVLLWQSKKRNPRPWRIIRGTEIFQRFIWHKGSGCGIVKRWRSLPDTLRVQTCHCPSFEMLPIRGRGEGKGRGNRPRPHHCTNKAPENSIPPPRYCFHAFPPPKKLTQKKRNDFNRGYFFGWWLRVGTFAQRGGWSDPPPFLTVPCSVAAPKASTQGWENTQNPF